METERRQRAGRIQDTEAEMEIKMRYNKEVLIIEDTVHKRQNKEALRIEVT